MGYRKSAYSASTNCVEVNMDTNDGTVRVRDSKNPGGTELSYTTGQWEDLIAALKAKKETPSVEVGDAAVRFLGPDRDCAIEFLPGEYEAFVKGVNAGEFDK